MWRDFFFHPQDYISNTLYAPSKNVLGYFVLDRAGINVKIWVLQLKRRDARAVYCSCLGCSSRRGKILVNIIPVSAKQTLAATVCLFFSTHAFLRQAMCPPQYQVRNSKSWTLIHLEIEQMACNKHLCQICLHEQSMTCRLVCIQRRNV